MAGKLKFVLPVLFLLIIPISAYALSSTYLPKAQQFIDNHCFKPSISNEKALLCYLFNKTTELSSEIETIKVLDLTQSAEINQLKGGNSIAEFDVTIHHAYGSPISNNHSAIEIKPDATWHGEKALPDWLVIYHTSQGDIYRTTQDTDTIAHSIPLSDTNPLSVDAYGTWHGFTKHIQVTITDFSH